jgi:ATP-dependent helicase Lhr and Lhr-like helicase
MGKPLIHPTLQAWLDAKQWKVFAFQREVWRAIAQRRSGLLHATTGSGKTYAVWLGALNAVLNQKAPHAKNKLRIVWLTPMRALATDTLRALEEPIEAAQYSMVGSDAHR